MKRFLSRIVPLQLCQSLWRGSSGCSSSISRSFVSFFETFSDTSTLLSASLSAILVYVQNGTRSQASHCAARYTRRYSTIDFVTEITFHENLSISSKRSKYMNCYEYDTNKNKIYTLRAKNKSDNSQSLLLWSSETFVIQSAYTRM